MRKNILGILVLVLFVTVAHAQSGLIYPENNFVNTTSDTLFFLPKSKVIALKKLQTNYLFSLEKIKKYEALTENYKKRILTSDSLNLLRKIESDIWFSKLQNNDRALEEQKKLNLKLNDDKNRIRRSRIYYFIGGVLATSIVVIALK